MIADKYCSECKKTYRKTEFVFCGKCGGILKDTSKSTETSQPMISPLASAIEMALADQNIRKLVANGLGAALQKITRGMGL